MTRVSKTEVRNIYKSSSLTDDQLDAAINSANLLVTTQLASESCMTADLLKEIELYLSAHFAVINEEIGGIQSERIGDAAISYIGQRGGSGLESTRYGQQVLLFDCSGKLTQIGKKNAGFKTYPRKLSDNSNVKFN